MGGLFGDDDDYGVEEMAACYAAPMAMAAC